MRDWSPERLAAAAGAALAAAPLRHERSGPPGPSRVTIDSRDVGPGDLFVGLPGSRTDGGRFASSALHAGAWGVVVAPDIVSDARCGPVAVVISADDPLAALQSLARAWRRELGARVLAITGSTGKTSTKDLLAAMLATDRRVVAAEQNLNTEIGAAADDPRRAAGDRRARAGDGDARQRADRRARGHRGARRRGHRQRRARAPRAARHGRGGGRREGRAHLRAAAGRDDRAARERAAPGPPPPRRPACRDVRRGRRRRRPWRPRAPLRHRLRAHAHQRAGGACGGARRRGRSARAARGHAQLAARPADRPAGTRRRHRGLLQRQPDVDARRTRRSPCDRGGATGRRARRHARARSRRAALPRRDRRACGRLRRRGPDRGRAARGAHGRALRR